MKSNIEIIIGPMYSGKSSALSTLISRYEHIKNRTMLINHCFDIREEESVYIYT